MNWPYNAPGHSDQQERTPMAKVQRQLQKGDRVRYRAGLHFQDDGKVTGTRGELVTVDYDVCGEQATDPADLTLLDGEDTS
jgi:hypothetical protein